MTSMKIENLFSVRGKIALITGGSRGLGEMFARAYVENGVKVYISSRKADACAKLAQELSEFGTCIALPADLSEMNEIERLADEIAARENRLDILINNAGASWGAEFAEFPESGWDKVMDLNLKSVFFMTQKLLPLLKAAGRADDYARVINIGSIEGIRTSHLSAYSYAASKAGLHHVTRMMAKYLAKEHIAVNAIAPGYFPSKMTDAIAEEDSAEILAHTPMQRWGQPNDMAGVALYLASKASAYVCGAVIPVDGGLATTN
jgi:NAD(P)-dependent dehydrogenase (short-subunit alcohol dehydrogenase family)